MSRSSIILPPLVLQPVVVLCVENAELMRDNPITKAVGNLGPKLLNAVTHPATYRRAGTCLRMIHTVPMIRPEGVSAQCHELH